MIETETFNLDVHITTTAREYAKKFAEEQTTVEKCKQVYLNTLAVYAVHDYFKITNDIKTNLAASDSCGWSPVMRHFHNVADLVLPGLGTLECRPVLPGETKVTLPPEVREERIGYLLVGFNEQLTDAKLLGFLPMLDLAEAPVEIAIDELKPLESLFDSLEIQEEINKLNNKS